MKIKNFIINSGATSCDGGGSGAPLRSKLCGAFFNVDLDTTISMALCGE